jgi:pSer/pThr/pTyr-binding forkhead associated (FHA) protein
MEEVHSDKASDYLKSLQKLGPKKFLAAHPHPVLLENYLAPSSTTKLGRVETVSELDLEDLNSPTEGLQGDALLQARVIPLEKRDKNSAEHMFFVGRSSNNDIVLLNKMVSKLHAYFCQVPGGKTMQLVDMNSTNGTFINSWRLPPSVKMNLDDADVISFGPETRLEFLSARGFCQLLQKFA